MIRKVYVLVFIILVQFGSLLSQSRWQYKNFKINRLTPDDGLSQGTSYFRYEDSQGFMWLTANDALNRYDGSTVKVYNLKRYFKQCPPLQQGYGFAEDNESNIYIGSTRGLYIYKRSNDKFSLVKIFKEPDEIVMPIGFYNGKIWCFNRVWQIATVDVRTMEISLIAKLNLEPISSLHIYSTRLSFYSRYPFIDKNNTIWMVSENDVASYNILTNVTSHPLDTLLSKKKLVIYACYYDSITNKLLFGTDDGILKYAIDAKNIEHITCIAHRHLNSVYNVISNKELLICKVEVADLLLTDKDCKEILWQNSRKEIDYFRTNNFSFDRSGRLWICVDGKGQMIFDFNPTLLHKEPGESMQDTLNLNWGVSCFSEQYNGDIVMHNVTLLHDSKKYGFIPSAFRHFEYYRKVTDTSRKGIWFYLDTYIKYHEKILLFCNQFNHITVAVSDNIQDPIGHLTDLHIMPNGKILCSTPKGLVWFHPATKSFQRVTNLKVDNPFKINSLSGNRLAISYLNNDLHVVQVTSKDSLVELNRILPGVQSFYIQEDKKRGVYWVGTNKGVYLLDNTFNIIKIFDANSGMAGTNIYGILLDDSQNVWCSHQRGLSSINAKSFQIINYDKSDGIQDWDFNNRAFYKAKDGTLYFGGVSGFNYFKPPLKPCNYYKPEVYIDEIGVNNKIYLPDTNANTIYKMKLPYDQNNISIKALVRDLASTNVNQIIYRLRTTDSVWKYLSSSSPIMFNNLASGSYTLELGMHDKFSDKNIIRKSILIFIATPFYKTLWFQLLLWSFISMLLVFVVYSFARKERKQIQLQKELAVSRHQTQSASINPHFIFNALNSVQHFMNLNDRLSANRYLTSFAKLIRKNFNATKSLEISLSDEIESLQLYLNLERMRQPDQFIYEIKVDESLETEDIKLPVMILQPFVENAILHGFSQSNIRGELIISFKRVNDKQLEILITDNGVGTRKHSSPDPDHQSSGLEMTQQRIELYAKIKGCEAHIESYPLQPENEINPGHVVRIMLPIQAAI